MHILAVGLNHEHAPVSLRERLALDADQLEIALARGGFGKERGSGRLQELVILSTCNRVELYGIASDENSAPLEILLAEASGVEVGQFSHRLYRLADEAAARHLFQVACGLDSQVLGEPQILGQVAEAYSLALRQRSTGPVLSRLFQGALRAGKRARAETRIAKDPASLSSVAVRLAEQAIPGLAQAQVLVVGAGRMAELAVEALRKRSIERITVVNRTAAGAQQLARRWQARAVPFERLLPELAQADIVICSTSAPHALIHRQPMEPLMRARAGRPLVIIDLAVPRDVDEGVGNIPGVRLYNIDQLDQRLARSLEQREREIPQVQSVIEQELQAFLDWLRGLQVVPLIRELRLEAEALRQQELQRALSRLPDLSEEERQRVDLMTRALVKKLLHTPTQLLKQSSGEGSAAEYAVLARRLFGLSAQPGRGELQEGT